MIDLIERLRLLEQDHEPDGWPAVRMRDITALLDAIEAAREDAARLDWLDSFADSCEYRISEYFGSAGRIRYVQVADRDGEFSAEAQNLRAAIDQARGKVAS